MTSIPENLQAINKNWISECFGGSPLLDFTLEPMGEGVGMMSAMAILHLNWDDSVTDKPATAVIKLAAENKTNREVSQQFNLYLKEVSYYRDLSPRTDARSPRVFASEINEDHDFFLLMEDVSDYRMGSQVDGATLEECELCIDFLARLHASFWNALDDVDWLPHMSNSDNARNMAMGCEVGWDQLMDLFGDFVPENINQARAKYVSGISELQSKLDQPPRTLIHGDFRMDNMLFGCQPDHEPLMVVDFQGPLKGNGIQDIAYLLSHSAQTEVRRANEKALLQRYCAGLAAAGVQDYSFDKAWEDYRIGVLYSWTVAVVIAGTMDPANDRGYAWMSKMVQRNGIAINDLDCLQLLD